MAKRTPLSLADVLDLPSHAIPVPYRGITVFRNVAEARYEVSRLLAHPEAPLTYQEACVHCQPKEIEFCNLVLGGAEHSEAAAKSFNLKGRSATNKGAILTTKTPRVMLALRLGREELALKGGYTFETAMNRLAALAEEARIKGQFGAAVRAEELKAKLAGLLRNEDNHVTVNVGDPRSDAELRAHAAQLAKDLGLATRTIESTAEKVPDGD